MLTTKYQSDIIIIIITKQKERRGKKRGMDREEKLYQNRCISEEERKFLKEYNIDDYFRPSLSSDIVAFTIENKEEDNYRKEEETGLNILLIKRGVYPYKGLWALPGGFMRKDENIEECAYREILEETNVRPISMKPVGVFSEVNRDPRGRIISNAFVSIISNKNKNLMGSSDADDAKWFEITFNKKEEFEEILLKEGDIELKAILKESRNEFGIRRFEIIENDGIAFDHAAIIGTALSTIRKDVLDLEVLFDFMPEKFTLLNLQRVQETILNKKLLPANFRRKVMPYVEETDEYVTGVGHRPAKLFTRKK